MSEIIFDEDPKWYGHELDPRVRAIEQAFRVAEQSKSIGKMLVSSAVESAAADAYPADCVQQYLDIRD